MRSRDTLSRNHDEAIPIAIVRATDSKGGSGFKHWLRERRRERLPSAFTLHFAGLFALSVFSVYQAAFSASLLFAGVAALALGSGLAIARSSVLHRSDAYPLPSARSIRPETHLALLLYAALGAALLLGARQAGGLDDPVRDWTATRIPSFMFVDNPDVTVYDKSHIRLALAIWLAFLAALSIILPLWWQYLQAAVRLNVRLRVPTAAFVMLALAGSFTLPPLWIDGAHWSVWIGPAVDIGRGFWPFFDAPSGYGLVSAAAVAAWVHLFAITDISLAVLVSLATLAAITLVYALTRAVTRSAWVGLGCAAILLIGFYDLPRAIAVPNTGALRWQLPTIAGLFCFWTSLSRRRAAALVASVVFAICCLWDPPFMGFLAIAFVCAHLYRLLVARDAQRLLPLAAAGGCAFGVLTLIGLNTHWPADGLQGIVRRTTETSAVYLEGFANRAQTFGWFELACLVVGLFAIYSIWRRVWLKRRVLRRTDLFLVASLCAAIPAALYDLGRTDAGPVSALVWVTLPSAALLLSRYYRVARMTRRPIWPAVVPALLLLATLNLPYALIGRADDLAIHYEQARLIWAAGCAQQVRLGAGCDLASLPNLQHALAAASGPTLQMDDPSNATLISACGGGQSILSEMDAFVYAAANCDSGDRPGSIVNTVVVPDIQQVLDSAMRAQEVAVDHRLGPLPHWTAFVDYAVEQLRQRGFVPIPQRTGSQVESFVSARALAGATEMLANAGFQHEADGNQSDWSVVGHPIFAGSTSAAAIAGGSVRVGPGDSLAQTVLAIPGTRYLYSVRARGVGSQANARLQLVWTDDTGQLVGTSVDVVPATDAFQLHAVLSTPPPEAVKGTVTVLAHTGEVWFADVSLQALLDGRPIVWGENLLADASFTGLRAGDSSSAWLPFGDASSRPPASSTPGGAVIGRPDAGYVQTVRVSSAKTYRIGHTTWSTEPNTRVRLQVLWLDAARSLIRPSITVVDVGSTPTWHAMPIRAPENAVYAEVWLTAHDGGSVRFENVALQELLS